MKVAFIIYNGMTTLDFIGVYDPLTRLRTMGFIPDLTWEIASYTKKVMDGTGLKISPTSTREPLGEYDIVIIPGGFSSRTLAKNKGFVGWLKSAEGCKLKASVCTGSLLLGAAGFLKGKTATTHYLAYDLLGQYCRVSEDRVVDQGDVITAGGVASALDLGLYLCEKFAGKEAKEKIGSQMCYQTVN